MEKYKPGQMVPMTCSYKAYDKDGHNGGKLHLEKGTRFPATQTAGSYYVMDMNDTNK